MLNIKKSREISDVIKVRGFSALTKEKKEVVDELMAVINMECRGEKALGFKVMRMRMISDRFDYESLENVVDLTMELEKEDVIGRDLMFTNMLVGLYENILYDYVHPDIAITLSKGIVNRLSLANGDRERVISGLKKYIQCGHAVSVAQMFREFEEEVEKGAVIYELPSKY